MNPPIRGPLDEIGLNLTRRRFFEQGSHLLGGAALAALAAGEARAATLGGGPAVERMPGAIGPHFAPKAKHVIYLHMVGGPPQQDLFDYKTKMDDWYDKDLPESVRNGQRLTTMTSGQKRFPIAPSIFKFARHGQCGMWVSEVLPWTAKMVDEMCFIRSMHTEAINHEPAICYMQTGNQIVGRPCLGSWTSYGLGSLNADLPTFVVLVARSSKPEQPQAIGARLWSSGFLPGEYSGVSFRSAGDPILYINNPPGVTADVRRATLDGLQALNQRTLEKIGDPETRTRIAQYEMAFAMQASVPQLMDATAEGRATLDLYGCQPGDGSFASNCLLARRLAERGVRFIQLYHKDWDHHGGVKDGVALKAQEIDRACMALVTDLKQRGMFDGTLVVWAGEFGRTPMSQGGNGRDHHNRAMSVWLAGGGIRGGLVHGASDDLGYAAVENVCTVHDLHATMLHLLGIPHESFSVKFQGLDARLTGVEQANVLHDILA